MTWCSPTSDTTSIPREKQTVGRRLSFDHLEMGLCRNYMLEGFEVAGTDRVFHPADKVWVHWQTNEVVVSSQAVPSPVAVRYCFHDFQPGTLIGGNELPAFPFRTDDW